MLILYSLFIILIVSATLFIFIKHNFSSVTDKNDLMGSVDHEVTKFLKKNPKNVMVIGVFKQGQSVIRGYHGLDSEMGISPSGKSIFQIGSLSKLITCSLLQRMADEGSLNIGATLKEVIGQQITLSPQIESITLQQLATHTSGFPRVPAPLLKKVRQKVGKTNILLNPYSHIHFSDIELYLQSPKGLKPPGKFRYSNFGLGLLGHILELVSGQSLEDLALEKVLKPLDMQSTGITLTRDKRAAMIDGYTSKGLKTPLWTFSALEGAGAFYSTMQDLIQFIKGHMSSELAVSKSLIAMLNDTRMGWMQTGIFEYFFGNSGFFWHDGMVGGYSAYIALDPQRKIGVAILNNNTADLGFLGSMLLLQARTQSWSGKPP